MGRVLASIVGVIVFAMACDDGPVEAPPTPEPAPDPTAEAPEQPEAPAEEPPEEPPEETFEQKVARSEPLAPTPAAKEAGGISLTPVRCTIEGAEFLSESGTRNISRLQMGADGKLYVLDHEGRLMRFAVAGGDDACALTLDAAFGDEGRLNPGHDLKDLSFAGGSLYATSGIFASYKLGADGQTEATCDERPRTLVMAPDASYGLGHFANSAVRRVTWTDSGCTAEDWAAFESPFSNVNTIAFIGRDIAIAGVLEERINDRTQRVVVIADRNGREKVRFGNTDEGHTEDRFGWVHDIEECAPGICVLDSNYRRLTLWDARGGYKGFVNLSEMFDLAYPWIPDFEVEGRRGGQAWFTAAQERGDTDVYEGVIYRVSGLR